MKRALSLLLVCLLLVLAFVPPSFSTRADKNSGEGADSEGNADNEGVEAEVEADSGGPMDNKEQHGEEIEAKEDSSAAIVDVTPKTSTKIKMESFTIDAIKDEDVGTADDVTTPTFFLEGTQTASVRKRVLLKRNRKSGATVGAPDEIRIGIESELEPLKVSNKKDNAKCYLMYNDNIAETAGSTAGVKDLTLSTDHEEGATADPWRSSLTTWCRNHGQGCNVDKTFGTSSIIEAVSAPFETNQAGKIKMYGLQIALKILVKTLNERGGENDLETLLGTYNTALNDYNAANDRGLNLATIGLTGLAASLTTAAKSFALTITTGVAGTSLAVLDANMPNRVGCKWYVLSGQMTASPTQVNYGVKISKIGSADANSIGNKMFWPQKKVFNDANKLATNWAYYCLPAFRANNMFKSLWGYLWFRFVLTLKGTTEQQIKAWNLKQPPSKDTVDQLLKADASSMILKALTSGEIDDLNTAFSAMPASADKPIKTLKSKTAVTCRAGFFDRLLAIAPFISAKIKSGAYADVLRLFYFAMVNAVKAHKISANTDSTTFYGQIHNDADYRIDLKYADIIAPGLCGKKLAVQDFNGGALDSLGVVVEARKSHHAFNKNFCPLCDNGYPTVYKGIEMVVAANA